MPRLGLIDVDLLLEGIQPIEGDLAPQPGAGVDPQPLAVEILAYIEQVHFKRRSSAAHRGSPADIGHPRQAATIAQFGDHRGGPSRRNPYFWNLAS